ncbi:PH domain-containing protein [Streptomyces viridochromogenes]|uniref:Putative Large integral membrane protein (Precursor) n=1 Tax=Streptomyces viridochromogenes Tue57 TaxID=1160705 RepID=L8PBF6_STRVR|nr:PH domain-containing protein [Streptomyces viridochromogenes]ELS54926.1 putative Large integral membrane protein (Precursor) [Streptomyces viridochromogenes Tue57]
MTDVREVTCRPLQTRPLWIFVGIGAAGAILAVARVAYRGELLDVWLGLGLFFALLGIAFLYAVTVRVSADAFGLHSRTLLRRRSVPWHDLADLRVYVQYGKNGQEIRRVSVLLRNGRKRRLPLPLSGSAGDRADFDAELEALRALHRRYGDPESSHVPVISYRTAGRGSTLPLCLCVLLLAGAGLAAWFVPIVESEKRAWQSAAPCTAETPAAERGECLTAVPAVIASTEVGKGKQRSWLYFADGRPLERLSVSKEGAQGFRPGDKVELTVWRRQVREVTGEHHVWREHFPGAGEVAVIAAVCALGAGYPGSLALLRRRGRRLAADEVLPSALPFAGALVGTALWLLPLCYLHPTNLLASPVAVMWAAAGSLATLGLFTWAWHATRVRTPSAAAATETTQESPAEEVFLSARFLEHTDYNPHGFGTHIVIGGGPPAVTPHPGPGRFAAKPIPAHRLAVTDVRRARGDDGDSIPRSWHIAELDDVGKPVRLAAAPADLIHIIRALDAAKTPAHNASPEP